MYWNIPSTILITPRKIGFLLATYSARLNHKGSISQDYILLQVSRKRNNENRSGFALDLDT